MYRANGIAEPSRTRVRNRPGVRVRKSGNKLADSSVGMNADRVTLIEIDTALAELMAAPKDVYKRQLKHTPVRQLQFARFSLQRARTHTHFASQ